MKKVLIYHDAGVDPSSFRHTFWAAAQHMPQFEIQTTCHNQLMFTDWEKSTALLVFPGGRDQLYHAKLQGTGNARIRSYVEGGGRFMGICAGAYYGASAIEFEKGEELEVCAARELAFFPGIASGPVYGKGIFRYGSDAGVRAAFLTWEKGAGYHYYNGGCCFECPESYPNTRILARYSDLPGAPAAAIHCSVQHGFAVLTGVHPEYSAHIQESLFHSLIRILIT